MITSTVTTNSIAISDLMEKSGVSFGTSGARGRVEEMTDQVCYAYTLAFLQYLSQKGELQKGSRVGVAGDLRASTDRIMNAVAYAIVDSGCQVINCGKIPSPAIAFYGFRLEMPTIMVTGSHIPDDRNGIKFNKTTGEILKNDEDGICSQFIGLPTGLFTDNGDFVSTKNNIGEVNSEATDVYIKRYLDFFNPDCLSGMKVGLYEHSGVGRDILLKVLHELGANVVRLGRSDVFMPVDTEAIRDEDVVLARTWAEKYQLDAIVSTDGDADRPLVGTEKGEWLRGDIVGMLCAAYLHVDNVVTPVSSNSAVESSKLFKSVHRTRIGSPYVISTMQQVAIEGDGVVGGYEANGGFLLASSVERDSRILDALPTRDATIVILSLLVDAHSQGKSLSSLNNSLPARFTASGRVKDFPTEMAHSLIASFADDKTKFKAINSEFNSICGEVDSVDLTDGLRITFRNNEIIHLRPSGNAPEFRCYTEAGNLYRVKEINIACIKKMNKWLNRQH